MDVSRMTDAEIEAAISGLGQREDARVRELRVLALDEKDRRRAVAESAARVAAPVEAAKAKAKAAWEAAGSPGSFDTFLAEAQRQDAHQRLDRQRQANRASMKF